MNLNDILEKDNKAIFNFCDISQKILIGTNGGNVRAVKGSLQADLLNFTSNAGIDSPLCAYACKLYIEVQKDMTLNVGAMISVDGKAFKIEDKREEMGVLELSLSRGARW